MTILALTALDPGVFRRQPPPVSIKQTHACGNAVTPEQGESN